MAAHQGIGYWSIAWTEERHIVTLHPEFDLIRGLFRFANPNRPWQAQRSNINVIKGDKAAYSLQDPDDVWKEDRNRPASDEDPLADLKLVASIKRRGNDFRYEAEMVVYLISPTADPLDDARSYLEQSLNKGLPAETRFTLSPVNEDPLGLPSPNVVEKNTEVLRLRAQSGNVRKLIVLSAIRLEDKVVFAAFRCPWSEREVFEQNFIATAGSLRAGR